MGGASLRWNLGEDREELKRCGRWTSEAYMIYLRKFPEKEMEKTRQLLKELRWSPEDKIEVTRFTRLAAP